MFVADKGFSVYPPDQLRAAGYIGDIGYCSPDPRKNITVAQIQANLAAGLHQGIVYESFNQAVSQGGGQGTKEAQDFLNQLRALGATGGAVYMVGEDPNKTGPSQAIRDYFKAAADILIPAGFSLGDYGSEVQVEDTCANVPGVSRKWFVGSWSQDTLADLIQQANSPGANTFGGAIDCNYAPAANWGWCEFGGQSPVPPAPVPAPAPSPQHAPDGNPFTILGVDGVFGNMSTRATQWKCGTGADGVFGYNSRRALQRHLGVKDDSILGPISIKALQNHVGANADGNWGTDTTRHLQSAENVATF